MQRITDTNKWTDDWFLDLSPNGKLIFMFLCEKCDDAGFFKLSTKHMHPFLKIPAADIVKAIKELGDKIIFNSSREKIWIRNFLFYQNQLPLEKNNVEHKKIKLLLEKNLKEFDDNGDILFIIYNSSSTKSKPVKKFAKPTIEEIEKFITEYSLVEKFEVPENISKDIFNHYESNGWKVGKNPMKDWKSAVRGWLGREIKKQNSKSGGDKIDDLIDATAEVKDVRVD